MKEIVKYLVKVVQVASKEWSKFRSQKVSREKMEQKKKFSLVMKSLSWYDT